MIQKKGGYKNIGKNYSALDRFNTYQFFIYCACRKVL